MGSNKIMNNKWIYLLMFSTITVLLTHFIEFGDLFAIGYWFKYSFFSLVFTFVFVFLISLFISVIFNNVYAGTLSVLIISFIISFVSNLKKYVVSEVLCLEDFSFIASAKSILKFLTPSLFLNSTVILRILLMILTVVLLCLYLRKIKNNKFRWRIRIPCLIVIPLTLYFGMFSINPCKMWTVVLGDAGHVNTEHKSKGIIAGLYLEYAKEETETYELKSLYSKEKIYSILNNTQKSSGKEEIKPNVIVLMSEAFFDVTKLPNVEFSSDPMPTIRSIMEEHISGNLIVGSYGKATANSEFELFTGNSVKFLPAACIPYNSLLEIFDKDIYSIQKEFKNAGYSTVGLHTYIPEFYNRNIVYPKIGFDSFYANDSFEDATYAGQYISDDYLVDQIIEKYENTKGDKFIFALSIQNHYPYSMMYYEDESPIKITSDKLSDISLDVLEGYVRGVYDVDKSIKKLIDYLETQEEPTILLFYGDHCPLLTGVYKELGYSSEETDIIQGEELHKLREVPFFIYNNFDKQSEKNRFNNMSLQKLGSFLLSYAGIEKSIYFDYIDNLELKVIYDRLFIDSDDKIYSSPPYDYYEEIQNYKLLQYDILYGNQYIKEFEKNKNLESRGKYE